MRDARRARRLVFCPGQVVLGFPPPREWRAQLHVNVPPLLRSHHVLLSTLWSGPQLDQVNTIFTRARTHLSIIVSDTARTPALLYYK